MIARPKSLLALARVGLTAVSLTACGTASCCGVAAAPSGASADHRERHEPRRIADRVTGADPSRRRRKRRRREGPLTAGFRGLETRRVIRHERIVGASEEDIRLNRKGTTIRQEKNAAWRSPVLVEPVWRQ